MQVLAKSSKAAQEMGPFAARLTARLGAAVEAGQVKCEDMLWVTAVEGLLLLCVDTDTQVGQGARNWRGERGGEEGGEVGGGKWVARG